MDKKQAERFIRQIVAAYPNFEPEPERLSLWARKLEGIDYELAFKRLDKYIEINRFPPMIADILNPEDAKKRKETLDEGSGPAVIINGGGQWML